MDYPERLSIHPLRGMVLNVTDACNCRCRYCFTSPNPRVMDLDTGIQAVKWFFDYNSQKKLDKKEKLSISFFGGEPTLRWDEFIYPLVQYVKTYILPEYKDKFDLRFSCTTNGQLLNKDRIKWFIENKGNFLLSIDGDRETQEFNRPRVDGKSSFDPVNENIDLLLKYQPDITFRSTLIPETAKNVVQDYLFARKRGFRNWFTIPNVRQSWNKEDLELLQHNMALICGIMLKDIEDGQNPLQFNWINRMIKAIMVKAPQTQHYMRCGLGTTSIGVATDGSLCACQENSTYHDLSNPFYIGDIYNGIDKERHLALLSNFDGSRCIYCKDHCKNCSINHICQGWSCPSTNFAMTGDVMERPEPMCEWLKILYFASANMILNAAQIDSKNFIEWAKFNTELTGGAA